MKFIAIFLFLYIAAWSNAQLYNKMDNVVIFNKTSFESMFNNLTEDNWFIQFYHSYCGHCINFAPIFKVFLKESKYWNWIIRFGVIDCSTERAVCKNQKISHYPYFKIFLNKNDKRAVINGIPTSIEHVTVDDVFKDTISLIDSYFQPKPLIQFNPENSLLNPFLLISANKIVDLKRTILLYHNRLTYDVYYQSKDIPEYSLALVNDSQINEAKYSSLEKLYEGLNNYLMNNVKTESPNFTVSTITQASTEVNKYSTIYPIYNQDIYASIFYAFTNDVTDEKLVNIDNLIILKKFILQLYQFSGFKENLLESFNILIKQIDAKIYSMAGRNKFVKSWNSMLEASKFPNFELSWIGCKGSKSHFRRYPCGLWTTFHVLTVNQYLMLQSQPNTKENALILIKSIREFIIAFFSCQECAQNFKKETASYETEVYSSKSAVLYLWKVHNSVNKRLSKAPSDDPKFPKIAFPPVSVCGKCKIIPNLIWPAENQWRIEKVFHYLIQHYSQINTVNFQTQPSLLLRSSTSFLVSLSSMDISVCVILSVFSSLVVIAAFLKFFRDSSFCRRKWYRIVSK